MPATYDPNCAIEDQASDSVLRTIALYKAAGWSQRNLVDVIENFWASTPQATPEAVLETEGDDKPTYEELVAEMHLLEEVCALYANDEDRFTRDGGEPYGSIPIDAGIKARSARHRFNEREAREKEKRAQETYCEACGELHPIKRNERKALAVAGEHSVEVTAVDRICEQKGVEFFDERDHDWVMEAHLKLNEKLGNDPHAHVPGVKLQELNQEVDI